MSPGPLRARRWICPCSAALRPLRPGSGFFRCCSCSASCGADACPVADLNAGDDGLRCATSVGGAEHRDEFGGGEVRESFALAFPPPVFLLVCHAAQWLLARGDDGHGGAYLFDFLARTKPHVLDDWLQNIPGFQAQPPQAACHVLGLIPHLFRGQGKADVSHAAFLRSCVM
ncbi:hypothetical protein Veis_3653 [Verminephrobacter eiseniae EF01-2]|uniref:Uncharacterized protein n=1 Tax=Verminephrobacter eiseniae (strain EF01-2) TaxID=391735 RepID=A1WP12_VEREI|nr:hypothetical protein Veis_3653 [Verminephrobacter eiseniae EF01-2]